MFFLKDNFLVYLESIVGRMKLNNFDLNDIYVDLDDGMEDLERLFVNGSLVILFDFVFWV